MLTPDVTVLFARADSTYKTIAGCDVYDAQRDAKTWEGGTPVVAHPPCRAWGRLKGFAKPAPGEKELAFLAVAHVRRYGGVLEHPKDSSLWKATPLPRPGQRDAWGGWTLQVDQFRWGHRAGKMSWFYIVGVAPSELPPIPMRVGEPTHHIGGQSGRGLLYLPRPEREHTPPKTGSVVRRGSPQVYFFFAKGLNPPFAPAFFLSAGAAFLSVTLAKGLGFLVAMRGSCLIAGTVER